MGVRLVTSGLANGCQNKLLLSDRTAHDWYRFVLSFPPHLVRDYLEKFEAGPNRVVLDPFCGTGTTVVECKKKRIPSIGIEAHPMQSFASHVKADWSPDPNGLLEHASGVAHRATRRLRSDGVSDDILSLLPSSTTTQLRSLPPHQMRLLLSASISPLPLHKVLTLDEEMGVGRDSPYYDHERLALARSLVQSIGNLHFGPEVGVGPPKQDAVVVPTWLEGVSVIAHDLKELGCFQGTRSTILRGDSRRVSAFLPPRSVDMVITSPPYPNEKDYTRTTRLESVILGFIRDKSDLRALKEELIRSNTRNVFVGDSDDRWADEFPVVTAIARKIEKKRIDLGKTSGFERLYARVTRHYFGGMAKHLRDLTKVLKPGAYLAYVVGDQASYLRVMIRTGEILAEIAESLGYTVGSIDLFRTRLATATREQLREEVVVLEWRP